jgi:hypothetical protein
MLKLVSVLFVLLAVQASAKDIIYANYPYHVDHNYVVVQNTNHRTGVVSDPVTIQLNNPKCYARACDYGARFTTQENLVFVYPPGPVLTTNSCKRGRDYVIKRIEYNPISCDINFCRSHGPGIAAVRSCSTEYCECASSGMALLRSCTPGYVFSPQFMTCDHHYKVYGCILARRQRK